MFFKKTLILLRKSISQNFCRGNLQISWYWTADTRSSSQVFLLTFRDFRLFFSKIAGGHIKSAINLENNPFKLLEIFFFREKVAETPEEMKEKTPKLASPTKELAEKLDFLDFCGEDAAAISKKMLVFHCEFSKCRGPKLYNLLRSFDREINFKNYPKLSYPQIFLLEGGYSEFYESFPVSFIDFY